MMRTSIAILGMISAAAFAVPASATVYIPGSPQFTVTPCCSQTVFTAPSIAGTIAVTTTTAGTFTDDFRFIIPQNGVGSGSVITTSTSTGSSNHINILSVTFDGNIVPGIYGGNQLVQFAALTGVPITAFATNDLIITYHTNGSGTYGGNLTFDAVPEPATWATFLLGFGFLGMALRRKFAGELKAA
jgi:hypothetical protein